MILPDRWADTWVDAWNGLDPEALLPLYDDSIQLYSPFAKVYARSGAINGKAELRTYWGEVMRRMPNIALEKVAVYSGHMALALHYRDNNGRNVIESVLFNERDLAVLET